MCVVGLHRGKFYSKNLNNFGRKAVMSTVPDWLLRTIPERLLDGAAENLLQSTGLFK
jgi:hypothetical protein